MGSKEERKQKLVDLVKTVIKEQPFERAGHKWAALHLDEWIKLSGWCENTLHTYFNEPPFYCEKARDEQLHRVKIVRVLAPGEKPKKTPQRVANEMRKLWECRKIDHVSIDYAKDKGKPWKVGGKLKDDGRFVTTTKEHGCLVGLAEVWPNGHQHKILQCVLGNWTGFMAYAKMQAAMEQDTKTGDPNLPVKGTRFFNYPYLSVVRRYHEAALQLYQDALQAGKKFDGLAA